MSKELKIAAAIRALDYVEDGMILGIGSGSTAEQFVAVLGKAVRAGLRLTGVATSERTAELCRAHEIPMSNLETHPILDLTIDGADEIDPNLNLIKGGGGALLREKIVAAASRRMIVIADHSKLVDMLGSFALPIEVNRFGLPSTLNSVTKAIEDSGLVAKIAVRKDEKGPFVTDGGHLIVDAPLGRIPGPAVLSRALLEVPGVVQHGLFLGIAERAVIAAPHGISELTSNRTAT